MMHQRVYTVVTFILLFLPTLVESAALTHRNVETRSLLLRREPSKTSKPVRGLGDHHGIKKGSLRRLSSGSDRARTTHLLEGIAKLNIHDKPDVHTNGGSLARKRLHGKPKPGINRATKGPRASPSPRFRTLPSP